MEDQLKAELGAELYTACKNGSLQAAIILSSLNSWRNTPPLAAMMAAAADNDHIQIIKYCLSQGGHISENVMLHVLTSRALETYTFLLTSKAVDPNYYIPWYGDILGNVAPKGDIKWTRLCLENGANPNLNKVDDFKTVLGATAEAGHTETMELLLQHGAWLQNSGALVVVAEAGREEIVKFLLQKGADVNEMGVENEIDERETEEMGTALHKAVANRHERVVKLLLEKGANIDLEDAKGRTALQIAEATGDDKVARLLRAQGSR